MRFLKFKSLSLLAAALLAREVWAFSPCDTDTKMVTELGRHVSWGRQMWPGEERSINEDQDVRYLRVLVKPAGGAAAGPWSLVVRDRAGRPLQSIAPSQVRSADGFWTDRLPVNGVSLKLEGSATDPVIETVEYVAMSKTTLRPYYSIQSATAAWMDLYADSATPSYLRRAGEAVGMFVSSDGNAVDGVKVWACSGFIAANTPEVLFVTNDHCGGDWRDATDRWTSTVCRNAFVDLSWDGDVVSREYACDKVVARSPGVDLAVIRLRPMHAEAAPPTLKLRRTQLTNEAIEIIHHPAADTKKVSLGCMGLTSAVANVGTVDLGRDFAYRCDTESGSSGAPVLDEDGRVVGIHHLGFERDSQARCDMLNKAVHVSKLIELLAATAGLGGYIIE